MTRWATLVLLLIPTHYVQSAEPSPQAVRDRAIVETLVRLEQSPKSSSQREAIERHAKSIAGTLAYIDLIERFQLSGHESRLLQMAASPETPSEGVRAVAALFRAKQQAIVAKALARDDADAILLAEAVGAARWGTVSVDLFEPLAANEDVSRQLRAAAIQGLAKTGPGRAALLRLSKAGAISDEHRFLVGNALLGAPDDKTRKAAAKLFKPSPSKNEPLPPLAKLARRRGNLNRGRELFDNKATCGKCHKVDGRGKEVGPDLSEIGSKLSREAIYVAILDPSAGVSHNYETYRAVTADGKIYTGLMMSRSGDSITIRNAEGVDAKLATKDVDELDKLPTSLMPADLQKNLSLQELVDVVEYVSMLRSKDAKAFHAAVSGAAAGTKRTPNEAVAALDAGEGLQAELFAAEPMMASPSNIDVDHKGRVWVCEIVNYRHFRNTDNPPRETGDRILVLEDSDGDGKADKKTVFYEGNDVDSAHGICVLGDRIYVSANDKVLLFRDTNGDLKPDSKQTLFSGIGGVQHDHGIHAFVFGPDGKLYFNFGNEGKQLADKDGNPIRDKAGNLVNDQRKPYQHGMAFRCDLDGGNVETIGWNFRNNWELCVDSFGTVWQSDNDDDGNRATRINFVMEFGDYGYRDAKTGAGWREPRIGMHEEIPLRHWHLRDPGVVPNVLQTGAGSPTGIVFYEGRLLPREYRNQLIHCDAGPNIVRQYRLKQAGAGYSATIAPVLHGARDNWFRPSDVCVAPDGSLIVADWYDPGVGGHRMGDIQRGRLFRVTPKGYHGYADPDFDVSSLNGMLKALRSPNQDTRYLAWQAIQSEGQAAKERLQRAFGKLKNNRQRARVLWLLGAIEGNAESAVRLGLADENANIRVTALRIARRAGLGVTPFARAIQEDKSVIVRREAAIGLREDDSPQAVELWVELARRHQGDRWYLEALGIGADGKWDACFAAWRKAVGEAWREPAGRDIVWRARCDEAAGLLAQIITNSQTSMRELERSFRALEFHEDAVRKQTLQQVADQLE